MDEKTQILLSSKLLEVCGRSSNASIYSLLPFMDKNHEKLRDLYGHSLHNLPKMLDSSLKILLNKKVDVAKTSYEFQRIKEEQNNFRRILSDSIKILGKKEIEISKDKIEAALSLIGHVYFDTLIRPMQFFIPQSPFCSGQWNLWKNVDYFAFKEKLQDEEFMQEFRRRILNNKIWKIKFRPEEFSFIIKKRLEKEDLFDKKLNPESMIKAIIIRMGELTNPPLDYEIIDFSIRSFFTYLGKKQYLRIDREILFLRKLEEEFGGIIQEVLES
ncbi:MAG: hypothetical protein ABIB47_06815 [Candidatus Woesearchaeota archaeon]